MLCTLPTLKGSNIEYGIRFYATNCLFNKSWQCQSRRGDLARERAQDDCQTLVEANLRTTDVPRNIH